MKTPPSLRNKRVNVDAILPADFLAGVMSEHPTLGLGMDVGTTTKGTSNPSVLALCQKVFFEQRFPLIVRWKSSDPAVARAIIRAVVAGLAAMNLRARRLCVDATSEKLFAVDLRRALAGIIPVELVVNSAALDYGGERMLYKAYLGNLFVNTAEDGYMALPPEPWVKTDVRSVVRERGTFEAEVTEDGGHGDVFDACKNALHAITAKGGGVGEIAATGVGLFGGVQQPRRGIQNPFDRKPKLSGLSSGRAR
jgi:hypothetical protein